MIDTNYSWQLNQTYTKIQGKWFYPYRAINKRGQTLDFYFSKKTQPSLSL
nr:DDE-type integrase/transposase/recombinase [Vibrio aestuarianus]